VALDPNLSASERSLVARRDRVNALELLEAMRRRIKPMLVIAVLFLLLTAAAAWLWPPTYRSSSVILIEQQEVPEDFVRSAVTSYADQRVQVIGQRVMTSANLLAIAHKFNLYARKDSAPTREQVLLRMRKDIRLEMISADVMDPHIGRPSKATIAFTVGFDSHSPQTANAVAKELTSLYLSENLESRRQFASGTAAFLNEEAQKLGARVTELEGQIAQFKEAHRDELPDLEEFNMQSMSRSQEDLRALDVRSQLLDQQIVFLDGQLAQVTPSSLYVSEGGERILSPADRLKIARTEYASASSVYSPDHPTVKRLKREIEGLEEEVKGPAVSNDVSRALTDAQGELAAARKRYSPEHPDVIALERKVAALEDQARGAAAAPASDKPSPRADLADNPAYIQLQSQKHAAEDERASIAKQKAELQGRVKGFEERLSQAPAVERDYNALMREFEGEKAKYADIRQKLTEAQLAANLETEKRGERFTVIEPPRVPDIPASPNRLAIAVLGCALSFAAAMGFGMILEALDTRIRGRRGIIALLDAPPLAVIPWVAGRGRA